MNGWQERYWLVRRGSRGPATGERRVEDFVCCEVPIGEQTAMALEIFTSRQRAEAELRGMERLAPDEYYPRAATERRGGIPPVNPTRHCPMGWTSLPGTSSSRCSTAPAFRTCW